MKISGIIITLTFLGASNSIGGASAIGDVLQNGLCSFVKSLKACPSKSSKCAYETLTTENYNVIHIIKQPCTPPSEQANCDNTEDEEICLKNGCISIEGRLKSEYSQETRRVYNNCRKELYCADILDEALCTKKECMWKTDFGTCWDKK